MLLYDGVILSGLSPNLIEERQIYYRRNLKCMYVCLFDQIVL